MYIRVLCTIIYQSDDLALSASDRGALARALGGVRFVGGELTE